MPQRLYRRMVIEAARLDGYDLAAPGVLLLRAAVWFQWRYTALLPDLRAIGDQR